jgi:subfamily B ATP-binding cassette protein HlyB/CyaB
MTEQLSKINDPGLFALVTIARFHNISADAAQLSHALSTGAEQCSAKDLVVAARSLGLKARIVALRAEELTSTPLPALALDHHGQHFILAKSDGKSALILESGATAPTIRPLDAISARSTGELILFASRASLAGELARFDFSWFIPAIVRYRKLLVETLGVSLLLQLFGLVSPLIFQVVMC